MALAPNEQVACERRCKALGYSAEESSSLLRTIGARYLTYDQLIQGALDDYSDYLEANKEATRVSELIRQLDEY